MPRDQKRRPYSYYDKWVDDGQAKDPVFRFPETRKRYERAMGIPFMALDQVPDDNFSFEKTDHKYPAWCSPLHPQPG
jgi:hypothetical protein